MQSAAVAYLSEVAGLAGLRRPVVRGAAPTVWGAAKGSSACQATILAPPQQDQGFQIVTPPSLTVNPGAEGF